MLVAEELIDSTGDLPENFDLFRNGIIDSLGIMRIVMAASRKYDLDIAIEEIRREDFQTIAAIAAFFNGRPA
ncbi:acyl carrier protein [Cohnella soli]|uniref:Acyl carrier protein n=1 Tax=Cohnella soli TaxID=425005 RepID=A0ABW0I3W5_9BACL